MGLFNSITSALSEASEAAHAARLRGDTERTLEMVRRMQPAVGGEALHLYLNLRKNTTAQWDRWSIEGKMKAARNFSDEARKHKDFDLGKACGFFLASAWLESSVRSSAGAADVFRQLEALAHQLEQNVPAPNRRLERSESAAAELSRGTALQELIRVSISSLLMAACYRFSRSPDPKALLKILEENLETGTTSLMTRGETRVITYSALFGTTTAIVKEWPEHRETFGDDEYGRRALRVLTLGNACSEMSASFGVSDTAAEDFMRKTQREYLNGKCAQAWVIDEAESAARRFMRTRDLGLFAELAESIFR